MVNPGSIDVQAKKSKVEVNTTGEVNQGTIQCLDQACFALGFHGATLTTTHDSEVTIDLNKGTLKGDLEGSFTLATTSGATVSGKMDAKLKGTASPYPTPQGLMFYVVVSDVGKWEAQTMDAKGKFSITVEGVVGFVLYGGGVFGGVVELD
ncbi:MAG: hypothetical protein HW388_1194 [Dehalococcoidia bacterium]|nr:hypothetical protein [Dehalococcoidia bacterium]